MLAALENYRDETKKATARCIYAQQGPAGPNRGVMALINNGFGSGCRLTFFAQQSTIPDFKPCVPRVLSINDNLGFCGLGLTPGNFPLSFFFFFFFFFRATRTKLVHERVLFLRGAYEQQLAYMVRQCMRSSSNRLASPSQCVCWVQETGF